MERTVNKQNIKAAYKFSIIAICIFYALYLASIPLLLTVNADYVFKNTLIPQFIKLVGKVLEVCGIAIVYAISVYSVYKRGRSESGRAYLLCGITAFVKCLLAQTVYWITSGGIPAFNNGLIEELVWLVILPCALEVLQFTVFFLIATRRLTKYRGGYEIASSAASAKGIAYPDSDSFVYPFKGAFDIKNPLLYGCFTGGIVITVSKLLLSILEEIDMAVNGLAIRNAGDLLLSVAGFFTDIACGVLAYTVMVFAIIKAFELCAKRGK